MGATVHPRVNPELIDAARPSRHLAGDRWFVDETLWVPETVHTAVDLLLRRQRAAGMIRRWRFS